MTLPRPSTGTGPQSELADVLAYLRRRRGNAQTIATRGDPQNAEWARDRERQLEVIIEELQAGLHLGCAEMMAGLERSGADAPAGEREGK